MGNIALFCMRLIAARDAEAIARLMYASWNIISIFNVKGLFNVYTITL